MERKYIINIRYLFLVLCIYLFVFQNLLQTYIPIFQYFDEIIALISLPFLFFNVSKKKSDKINNSILMLLFIILILGVTSNILYKFQIIKYVLFDIVIFFKFYLIYFLSGVLWCDDFLEKYTKNLKFHLSFITLILSVFTVFNYIFVIWPSEFRYGILSNKLFFSQPTFLAGVCMFLLSLSIRTNKKIIIIRNIIILVLLLSTLRFKAIGAAIAILFVSIYVDTTNKKITISKVVFIGLILLIFAFDQINFYFFKNDGFARKELLNASVEIAKDYFPLGTGFGTFGSFYSAENYSPVYYKYNLDRVYGLSPEYHYFVADSFYPMLLGQFGIIGIVLYCVVIFMLFRKIQQIDIRKNKYEYISKMCAFAYLIISSSSESSFTGPMAISLALILGFGNTFRKKEE